MNGYIATTRKIEGTVYESSVIAVCVTGPTPRSDAESYAHDHTSATGEKAYVYEVYLREVGSYRVRKEVVFDPSK